MRLAQATPDERSVIQAELARAVQEFARQTDLLLADFEMAREGTPQSLEVPIAGFAMTPPELRTAILLAAREIDGLAHRLETGAAAGYLTAVMKDGLAEVHRTVDEMVEATPASSQSPIQNEHRAIEERYRNRFARPLLDLIGRAETLIVSAEAREVNVREPMERAGTVLALAALIAVIGGAIYFASQP